MGASAGLGWRKHLAFSGSEAVVKHCAEIILIRLGQSSCIMGLLSPPFSAYCAEHSHRLKHHFESSQGSLQPFKLAWESIFTCGNSWLGKGKAVFPCSQKNVSSFCCLIAMFSESFSLTLRVWLGNTRTDGDCKQCSPTWFCCQGCELHRRPGSCTFSVLSLDAANNTCRDQQMQSQEEITSMLSSSVRFIFSKN